MLCINLQERFGRRYKVTHEESYCAEYGPNPRSRDPWLLILLCQRGHICPWGDDLLCACARTNGATANRLRRLPFAHVAQDGDDGVNVVFASQHFDAVAKLMKPLRRRRLTERQKLAAAERLLMYRYRKDKSGHSAAGQRDFVARSRVPKPRED